MKNFTFCFLVILIFGCRQRIEITETKTATWLSGTNENLLGMACWPDQSGKKIYCRVQNSKFNQQDKELSFDTFVLDSRRFLTEFFRHLYFEFSKDALYGMYSPNPNAEDIGGRLGMATHVLKVYRDVTGSQPTWRVMHMAEGSDGQTLDESQYKAAPTTDEVAPEFFAKIRDVKNKIISNGFNTFNDTYAGSDYFKLALFSTIYESGLPYPVADIVRKSKPSEGFYLYIDKIYNNTGVDLPSAYLNIKAGSGAYKTQFNETMTIGELKVGGTDYKQLIPIDLAKNSVVSCNATTNLEVNLENNKFQINGPKDIYHSSGAHYDGRLRILNFNKEELQTSDIKMDYIYFCLQNKPRPINGLVAGSGNSTIYFQMQ